MAQEKKKEDDNKLATTINTDSAKSVRNESSGVEPQPVVLIPSLPDATDDQGLWPAIRDRTNAISFNQYSNFINRLFCLESEKGTATCTEGPGETEGNQIEAKEYGSPSIEERRTDLARRPSIHGVDSYQLLKLATQAFLSFEAGIVIKGERNESTGAYESNTDTNIQDKLMDYLAQLGDPRTLPYLKQIANKLISNDRIPQKSPYCGALLRNRFTCPSMLELIWSYWQEEGMLVQSLNAIAHRFQNRRLSENDPLINLELDPIRPLNNLLWGFIQDARSNMSTDINQRSHEYLHHYGISLYGKAVKSANPADKRSNFIAAFHTMLQRVVTYYKQDADTTIKADAFPLMQAIKDVHLILAEGAHNQFGDLPWTTRAEMLMMQWLLARDELREFLRGRLMVPYKEKWMGTVDAMKRVQGWTGDTVTHFRDLAVFGEQIVLSVRWGNWSNVTDDSAKNWANYWKHEIQSYIHSYHSVTGVDLSMDNSDTKLIQLRNMQPSIHLQKRLLALQRTKGGQVAHTAASGNTSQKKTAKQAEVMPFY